MSSNWYEESVSKSSFKQRFTQLFETLKRPERVLQLKQLCIDRRQSQHRQLADFEDVGQLNNDFANNSTIDIDIMRPDTLPVELGFNDFHESEFMFY